MIILQYHTSYLIKNQTSLTKTEKQLNILFNIIDASETLKI